MAKQVTLTDVAQKSQVSPSTVSLALRNKPGIPPETRRRIVDAARQLGYRHRNAGGKNEEVGQTRQVETKRIAEERTLSFGLLVKTQHGITPQANPFYSQILASIADACGKAEVNLLYALVPVDDHNLPTQIPQLLKEDTVDGLFIVGAFMDKTLDHMLSERHYPIVLVDAYSDSGIYDAVVSDNLFGAYQAVLHLIEQGHRHIGIIGSQPDTYPSILERRKGYLQALHDHQIQTPYFGDTTFEHNSLVAATHSLLSKNPQISALFCCNDASAIVAMQTAVEMGMQVPNDLSIIGFDNIDLAQHVTPSLTTMHIDKVKMGRLAVQLLLERLEDLYSPQVTCTLRPQLVKRNSTMEIAPHA